MGISGFFSWLSAKAYKDLVPVKTKLKPHQRPELLLIDLNEIFHRTCDPIYNPKKIKDPNLLTLPLEDKKRLAIDRIRSRIDHLVDFVNPTKAVYFAVDGVAGCCKQPSHRCSQFRKAKEAEINPEGWKATLLMVGMPLMKELDEYLTKHWATRPYGNLRILYNPMGIPGEGEHKIIHFIKQDRTYRKYCICSQDADLMMLTMLLPSECITILRKNDASNSDYHLIQPSKIKNLFLNEISGHFQTILDSEPDFSPLLNHLSPEKVMRDIVVLFFLLGNDYLPRVSMLYRVENEIDELLKAYIRSISLSGYLIDNETNEFNLSSMRVLFYYLADLEKWVFQKTESFDRYRQDYYLSKLGHNEPFFVQKMCEDYLRGMSFVWKLYSKEIPTFDWSYPFHYTPFLTDLRDYLNTVDRLSFSFCYQPPLSQVETLAGMLHPRNFDQLPPEVNEFMTRYSQQNPEYFPSDFKLDREGKKYNWDATACIPMISYDLIKELLRDFSCSDPEGKILEW